MNFKNNSEANSRQSQGNRRSPTPSIFELMTTRESRQARVIAYREALAVIG